MVGFQQPTALVDSVPVYLMSLADEHRQIRQQRRTITPGSVKYKKMNCMHDVT